MEDNGRKTWYDGSMKKGKDPRGGLRRVFCYAFDWCVFTGRGCQPTASGGHIFRCTTKDMEERRAKGIAIPLNPLELIVAGSRTCFVRSFSQQCI